MFIWGAIYILMITELTSSAKTQVYGASTRAINANAHHDDQREESNSPTLNNGFKNKYLLSRQGNERANNLNGQDPPSDLVFK